MSLSLRPLLAADIAALRDITWRSWKGAYTDFIPEADLRAYFDEHYSAEAVAALLSAHENQFFLAELAGRSSGWCRTLFRKDENRFYIPSIYILPDCQNKGIGSVLLASAIQHARQYGVAHVWLGVMSKNTAALDWYRHRGFQFVREEPFIMGATTVAHLIGYKNIVP